MCIAQIPLGSSRHISTLHDTYDIPSVSSRAWSNMADDEEAAVLACTSLVFCSLDLHHSQEQLLEKVRWTCPPQSMLWKRVLPVSSVALVVTIMSRRAVWQARHVSTRLVTSRHDFSLCQNVWARWRDVSRRDMTWHDESCGMWAYVCTESRPRYISVCVCVCVVSGRCPVYFFRRPHCASRLQPWPMQPMYAWIT